MPAHIVMKWIHRVFSNLKRWGLGTFHGFREKHLDAYLNEFAFRWNRKRLFQSNLNSMLCIGHRIGRVTRDKIVGDTWEWRKAHRHQILDMLHPMKRKIAEDLSDFYRVDVLRIIEDLRHWVDRIAEEETATYAGFGWDFREVAELCPPQKYPRHKADYPALPRRRRGEERYTRRYRHPPRPDIPERTKKAFPADRTDSRHRCSVMPRRVPLTTIL